MRTRINVNGILLLDKSIEMTSNRALQRAKWLFSAKKAGHTGSLDPLATGMLPLCFGEATKFSQFLLEANKVYEVTAKLGERTLTGDSEGDVVETRAVPSLSEDTIEKALSNFRGDIMQIPPMYSALKYQGRPLYELARAGQTIERQPRAVCIHELSLVQYNESDHTLSLRVHCSKGTYIRTLIEDLGELLQCGAHVIALRRTAVTPYEGKLMYTLSELEAILEKEGQSGLQACLLPAYTSVAQFPAVKLSTSAAFYLRQGQSVRTTLPVNTPLVQLFGDNDQFLGVGEVLGDGRVKPQRLVVS